MEAALVSAATGVLKPVLAKLAALLGDEYKRFKGVRKEIRFLIDELEAMHAFLLKMSEDEDPDVQDKVWAAAVRELSYDMEDTIDDFMQSVNDKDAKPDGFIEKIKHSLGKLGKMKTCHRIGSEIQDMKKLWSKWVAQLKFKLSQQNFFPGRLIYSLSLCRFGVAKNHDERDRDPNRVSALESSLRVYAGIGGCR